MSELTDPDLTAPPQLSSRSQISEDEAVFSEMVAQFVKHNVKQVALNLHRSANPIEVLASGASWKALVDDPIITAALNDARARAVEDAALDVGRK